MISTKRLSGRAILMVTGALILVYGATWRLHAHDDRVVVCKYLKDPGKRYTPAGQLVAAADVDISNLRALVSGLGNAAGESATSPNASSEAKATTQQPEDTCS